MDFKVNSDGSKTYFQFESDVTSNSKRKILRTPGGYVYSKKITEEENDDAVSDDVLQWSRSDPRQGKKTEDLKKKINFDEIEKMFVVQGVEDEALVGPGPTPYKSLDVEVESVEKWMDEFLVPALAKNQKAEKEPPRAEDRKRQDPAPRGGDEQKKKEEMARKELIPIENSAPPKKKGVLPDGIWEDEFHILGSNFRKRLPGVEEIAETRYLYGPQKMVPVAHRRRMTPKSIIEEAKRAGLYFYDWAPVQMRVPVGWHEGGEKNNYEMGGTGDNNQPAAILLGIFRFIDPNDGDTGPGYKDIAAVPAANLKDYIVDVMRVNLIYVPENPTSFNQFRNADLKENTLFDKNSFKFGTYFLSLYGLK